LNVDLGNLAGPILIFGGAYSNRQATEALYTLARKQGIPPGQIICTGDCVAYCGEPEETVHLHREWGINCLMGNCEESLAAEAVDCGCGFEAGSACDVLTNTWYPFALQNLSTASKTWMQSLPREIRFQFQGRRFLVVHGSVGQINRFVFHSSSDQEKCMALQEAEVDAIIGGHCGLPFGQQLPAGVWLNAGAIGMPANDGTRDGWYMRMDGTPEKGIRIRWQRLQYDAMAAYTAMQNQGLGNGYADALLSGLWPSMDVLPSPEQQHQGCEMSVAELSF